MRIAVVILMCALLRVDVRPGRARYAAAGATAPPPPATETVAPAIPGVVAAGTKVAIVKDGFQSSEGPILMPDGTTLFTEPGASKVHKIDKNGTISTFVENTGTGERPRARFEGPTHRDDGADDRSAASAGGEGGARQDVDAAERPRRRQERRRLFHAAERQTLGGVLHSRRRPGDQAGRSARRARHPAEPGREDAVFGGFGRRVSHCVRRAARRQADESPQLRQVPRA